MSSPLGDRLRIFAKYEPDFPAVIQGDRRITWKQINDRTNRLANALLALGVKKGDKVAIMFRNCPEFLESNFALQKIGAVPVPLNFRYVSKEVEQIVNDSDSSMLIFEDLFLETVKAARPNLKIEKYICAGVPTPGTLNYEELIELYSPKEPKAKVVPGDVALLCYTGGTTGAPKGVVLTYDNLHKNFEFTARLLLTFFPAVTKEELESPVYARTTSERKLYNAIVQIGFPDYRDAITRDPELSKKVIVIRFRKWGSSLTLVTREGKLKILSGEPERWDLLFTYNLDDMTELSKLLPMQRKLSGKLRLLPKVLRGKIGRMKPFFAGMRLVRKLQKAQLEAPPRYSLCVPPLFHIAAYMAGVVGLVHMGQPIIFPASLRFDPKEILEIIDEYKPQMFVMVPTQWKKLVEYPGLENYDLNFVSMGISGGAPFPAELKREVIRTFPNLFLIDGFGLTEVSAAVMYKADADEEEVKDRCIGKPVPGVEIRIVDEQGRDVKPGEVGELIYRGDVVMKEYYGDPEKTASRMKEGWFYSGDLGYFGEDGYIYAVERKEICIISGGEKIYPLEVEEVIQKHPKVDGVCVIGVPDKTWGEAVRAVVKLKEGESSTAEEIINWCAGKMASYKKPKSVVFVESFPVSPVEKVLRAKIKEMYGTA